jgi:hypothetical protein
LCPRKFKYVNNSPLIYIDPNGNIIPVIIIIGIGLGIPLLGGCNKSPPPPAAPAPGGWPPAGCVAMSPPPGYIQVTPPGGWTSENLWDCFNNCKRCNRGDPALAPPMERRNCRNCCQACENKKLLLPGVKQIKYANALADCLESCE